MPAYKSYSALTTRNWSRWDPYWPGTG